MESNDQSRKSTTDGGVAQLARVYKLMFNLGEVVEIRAIGGLSGSNKAWEGRCFGAKGTASGYFDNPLDFERCAKALDDAGAHGVYFTLNPCKPAVLARAANRLKANVNTTTDAEIKCIRWLPIDLDPKRPSGVSSSNEELQHARDVAQRITEFLEKDFGWGKAVRAISGNGVHLMYRLPDLPNTPETTQLIKRCLIALAGRFGGDLVEVDQAVFNPARIWKVYGTMARKGDHTEDRPHRRSGVGSGIAWATLPEVPTTLLEKVQALADLAPAPPQPSREQPVGKVKRFTGSNLGMMDVGSWLQDHGIAYHEKTPSDPEKAHLHFFVLDEGCLFDSNHRGGEAAIVRSPQKPFLFYQCFHNSCKGTRTFKDARKVISGEESLRKYYPNYHPTKERPKPNTGLDFVLARTNPVYRIQFMDLCPRVPLPEEIDPWTFFEESSKGNPSFVPRLLADYILDLMGPLYFTMESFYRYEQGVFRRMEKREVQHVATLAMKKLARPNQVNSAVELLQNMVMRPDRDWPREKYINCLSGMLDPDTGKLLPHDPKYLSRVQVKCEYDWKYLELADPFLQWLQQVQPGKANADCIEILHRYAGYTLNPDNRHEKVLFLFGQGGNGKGTYINVLTQVLGKENASALSLHDLSERFNTYRLATSMLNCSTEVNPRKNIETEILKAAVSGDLIKGEEKFGAQFEFYPRTKFIYSLNKKPLIMDVGYALERRLIVVPFDVRYDDTNKDTRLLDKLVGGERRNGVFMWMILGHEKVMREGFELKGRVRKSTDALLLNLNPAMLFAREICVMRPGDDNCKVGTVEIYQRYEKWCKDTNHKVLSRNNFWEAIKSLPGVQRKRDDKDRRHRFIGIMIRPDDFGADSEGDEEE